MRAHVWVCACVWVCGCVCVCVCRACACVFVQVFILVSSNCLRKPGRAKLISEPYNKGIDCKWFWRDWTRHKWFFFFFTDYQSQNGNVCQRHHKKTITLNSESMTKRTTDSIDKTKYWQPVNVGETGIQTSTCGGNRITDKTSCADWGGRQPVMDTIHFGSSLMTCLLLSDL